MKSMDERLEGAEKLKSDDDVDEILKLALRLQTGDDEDLRARLIAAADELGISDTALAEAEEKYLKEQADEKEFREFKSRQRREFREHLFSYLIVNTMLVAINYITAQTINWAIWSILGWGIGLAFHAWNALNSDSESFQEEYEAFHRKKERRKRQ